MNTRIAIAMLLGVWSCQSPASDTQHNVESVDSLSYYINDFRTRLLQQPQDVQTRLELIAALIEQKNYSGADSQTNILVADTATLDQGYMMKALLAISLQDTASTIHFLSEAIKLRPMESDEQAVLLLADIYLKQGKYREALAKYQLASRINPDLTDAYYGMGRILEINGQIKEAQIQYEAIIQQEAYHFPSLIRLGILAENKGSLEKALQFFQLAAKADPTAAEAYYHRGRVWLALGKREAGLDDLTKALSFQKNYPEAAALLQAHK